MSTDALTFAPVTAGSFQDFARLFETKGGPSYCWCLAWRFRPDEAVTGPVAARRAAQKATMEAQVRAGTPVGILAYRGGEPVGWCSVAPRETYRPLGGPEEAGGPVWSIVCFYVPRALRRQGISGRLLDAAVVEARRNGARIIEAYPVDPDSPSYRFGGFVSLFAAAGFAEVARAGSRRHVMRLVVGPGG